MFANGTAINNAAFGPGGGLSNKILQAFWTGAKYAVTDQVDVIGAYYHYIQNDYTTENCTNPVAHSQCAGTMDAVSFVVDWRFASKFDAYAGLMFSQMNGGLLNGFLARNNIDPTVGLRFKF
jgi:predicted porin